MYVSINMDDLQFVHKHADHDTCSALAWLEMPHKSVTIESTDREFFLSKMTALDLRMLYRNTTALDITGTDHIVVREMLATLVDENLTATFAHIAELDAQIALVEGELYKGIPWKYALGSRRPAKQEELFSLHCKPLDPVTAYNAAQRAPQRRKLAAAPQRAPAPASAPSRPAVPKQRMSSVRPQIWAVADRMWSEAGSPTDKTAVLELRKKMMVELEEKHFVKRTSSSNELGNWMKERLT